jgi:hypothetical protein
MKAFFRPCFILLLILCSSCIAIPYHFTDRPGAKGIITDKQTEAPLANVHINLASISEFWDPTDHLSVWRTNQLVSTDSMSDGAFEIPPKKEWNLLIIPSDVFSREYELTIEHTNYQPFKIQFIHSPMNSGKYAVTNFGNVKLTATK